MNFERILRDQARRKILNDAIILNWLGCRLFDRIFQRKFLVPKVKKVTIPPAKNKFELFTDL